MEVDKDLLPLAASQSESPNLEAGDDNEQTTAAAMPVARDEEDEKHVHPLQLDVIERCVVLWSNPGETVFTPFMGVGSEVYGAVLNNRRGIGAELKKTYFVQAKKNVELAHESKPKQASLFN